MREQDIIHENGDWWVLRESHGVYKVFRIVGTHSERWGIYALTSKPDEARRRAIEACDARAEFDKRMAGKSHQELHELAKKAGLWDYLGHTRERLVSRLFLYREALGT